MAEVNRNREEFTIPPRIEKAQVDPKKLAIVLDQKGFELEQFLCRCPSKGDDEVK